jgi:hypothetical protein
VSEHAFDLFPSPRFEAVINAIEVFAAWVMAQTKSQDQQSAPRVR